jgi:hypothetical protein
VIDDLKNKIKSLLKKTSLEESDVLYLLVEIGKIIEKKEIYQDYQTLWFYRNWVAHTKIEKQSVFVKNLKEKIKKIDITKGHAITAIFGFISFIDLKNEIIRFFHQQIENGLLPSKSFLDSVQVSLVQILADVPVNIDMGDKIVKIYIDKNGKFTIQGIGQFKLEIKLL